MNSRQRSDISMDKFWEDQWSSQMQGWATLAKHGHSANHYTPHSPSASESSSFSVSTRDSPSLSVQSEASPIASRYMLQSPDLWQARFCKIGPDTKHAKSSSMDGSELLNKKLEKFLKAKERLVQSPIGLVHDGTQGVEGSLSDGTESWASASSQELSCNHLCDETIDIHSSIAHTASNIHPTNHFHGQGERGSGATEQAGHHDAQPVIANRHDDENASQKHSYADEITACENEGCIHESLPSHFDDRTRAPALASPGSEKVQFRVRSLPKPHAGGLETRCVDRYKSLSSRGHAGSLNANMLSKPQEVDAYCRRNAHQGLPVQAGDGHRPFARGLFKAENIALQLQEQHDCYVSNTTNSKTSTYIESTSHTRRTHLKSRHSAPVEDKYPLSSLHGYFRFVEQDGSACYSFSVHDSDEVFFARACALESDRNKEDHNCLYTFHSRRDEGKTTKGGWKSWLKKEKLASTLVGKMKVSNAKRMRTENRCTEETHFVLCGESSQLPVEQATYDKNDQMSGQLDSKLLKPVLSSKSKLSIPTLGSSHSQKLKQRDVCHMSVPGATAASQGIIRSCLHEPISRDDSCRHGSCNFVDVNISKNFIAKQDIPTTQVEIAAIVITTTLKEYKMTRKKAYESSSDAHGWGATFLEKGLKKGWGAGFLEKSSAVSSRPAAASEDDAQQQLNAASNNAFESDMERLREHTDLAETYPTSGSMPNEKLTQKMSCSKHKQPKIAVDVVVILPARHHGLLRNDGNCPTEDGGSCGPTSLLERWQSGGNCDCGGWDMGCGLSLFKAKTLKLHKKRETVALTTTDQINWISPEKPLQIFTQGYEQKRLLMLEIIQAGLFSLSFQARFSPLQAFATAVAIFHQQITHK